MLLNNAARLNRYRKSW